MELERAKQVVKEHLEMSRALRIAVKTIVDDLIKEDNEGDVTND